MQKQGVLRQRCSTRNYSKLTSKKKGGKRTKTRKKQLKTGRTKKCFITEYSCAVHCFCKRQENQNNIVQRNRDPGKISSVLY